MPGSSDAVLRYHDGTKHHFQRFARSLGYLDWASQPAPFRSFAGAPCFPLCPSPDAPSTDYRPRAVSFDDLFAAPASPPAIGTPALGDLLRHALGLSAWKAIGLGSGRETRWSLRCNPSSGNLHPTEAYVVSGPLAGLSESPGVYHYAADRHLLELRCTFDARAWRECSGDNVLFVALTSIHWRESWKYGERAFRYCQHDLGHAIAALVAAASAIGWRACLVPEWPQASLAALTGIDRDEDFVDAEREEPSCLLAIGPDVPGVLAQSHDRLIAAARAGQWFGRASQLSENHVQWTFIDEIAAATRDAGREGPPPSLAQFRASFGGPAVALAKAGSAGARKSADARAVFLQRRSAVAFDGVSSISRDTFLSMLGAVMPHDSAPWSAIWWTPRVHLALFVHRVDGVAPGVYLLPRDELAIPSLHASMTRDFLWETEATDVPLLCLARGDARRMAARLSCDQDIAADGFFSLGMIAAFDASLGEYGPSFYRHLFWEAGFVGQILYLEAEAAGVRATGIGCYYDDPVHDVLGLRDHAFQSLYHFTVGTPVEDARLTTMPGYTWELVPGEVEGKSKGLP